MLKIAAADKSWLQHLVLAERRRLASLHHAALIANTETAIQDHEGDAGYEAALSDKKQAPKTAAFGGPNNPRVGQNDLETFNVACEHVEDQHPEMDPAKVFNILNAVMEPGLSITELLTKADPMLRTASKTKKADAEKDNTDTAIEDHKGDPIYENALDPKVGGRKRSGLVDDAKEFEQNPAAWRQKNPGQLDPPPSELKFSSKKTSADLKVDDSGNPPNTSKATQDHDFELKALAAQVQSMLSGKTAFDPNDPLKD